MLSRLELFQWICLRPAMNMMRGSNSTHLNHVQPRQDESLILVAKMENQLNAHAQRQMTETII